MLDFLVSGEPMAASQTLTPTPDGQTFPRGPRVDHFIFFTSALATAHNLPLLLIVVTIGYHTRYWVVKGVMQNCSSQFGDNSRLHDVFSLAELPRETPNPKHQTPEKLQTSNPKTSEAGDTPDRDSCKMGMPCRETEAEPSARCHDVVFGISLELGAFNRFQFTRDIEEAEVRELAVISLFSETHLPPGRSGVAPDPLRYE